MLWLVVGFMFGEASNPGPLTTLDDPEVGSFDNTFDEGDIHGDGGDCGPWDIPPDDHSDHGITTLLLPEASRHTATPCPGDWKLSDEQLVVWRELESAIGIGSRPAGTRANKRKAQSPDADLPLPKHLTPDVFPAKVFKGVWPGYVSRSGEAGLGYYVDRPRTIDGVRLCDRQVIDLDSAVQVPQDPMAVASARGSQPQNLSCVHEGCGSNHFCGSIPQRVLYSVDMYIPKRTRQQHHRGGRRRRPKPRSSKPDPPFAQCPSAPYVPSNVVGVTFGGASIPCGPLKHAIPILGPQLKTGHSPGLLQTLFVFRNSRSQVVMPNRSSGPRPGALTGSVMHLRPMLSQCIMHREVVQWQFAPASASVPSQTAQLLMSSSTASK